MWERLFQADFPGMCVYKFKAVVMTRLHTQCFCNRSYFFLLHNWDQFLI